MSETLDDLYDMDDAGADEHVSALLAGYALGALDPPETERVLRHLQVCPRCSADLATYEVTAGLLAYSAPVQQVPVRVRGALLTRVAEIGSTNPEQMIVLSSPPRRRRFLSRVPRAAWISLAPAAVLVIAFIVSSVLMQDRINDQKDELRTAERDRGDAVQLLAIGNTARFVSDLTATNTAPDARARLFVDFNTNQAMLVAINLPMPTDGSRYVAWLSLGDESVRIAELEVDDIGRTQLIINPPDSLDRYDSFFVTLEGEPDASTPSGPQVFSGSIHPQGNGDRLLGLVP